VIYLVGGPPRTGKTKLAEHVIREHPMHAISTDAIRYMLRRTVPKHELSGDLFLSSEKHIRTGSLQHILKDQNDESEALWPYLVEIMNSYQADNYDLLLEGVAVIPWLLNKLEFPYRAIIIGNSDETHDAKVIELASSNDHDWLHHHDPGEAAIFTKFFAHMSDWLKQEADRYGIDYHVMHDESFEDDLLQATHRLLG
jgi:2-phosphoglycerate kinase